MANVQPYVDQIRASRYGRDVRESIASGIEAMNTESETAYNQAISSQTSCVNLAGQAQTSATASANSAAQAKTSEQNAATIVSNVQTYETSAKASATAAKTSEQNALASETNAKTSETNSKASELAAQTSASQSSASATASKTSETNAQQYSQSALASSNSAQNYANQASSAQTSCATSAQNAKTSETNAENWAKQAATIANIDVATTTKAGIVKPDGSTILVDQFGRISTNITEHTNKKVDSNDGAHGVRVVDGDMQYWDETTETWVNALDADAIAYDVSTSLKTKIDNVDAHKNDKVDSTDGAHGLRYANDELSYKNGATWTKIPTGHDLITTETALNQLTQTGDKVVEAYLVKTIVDDLKKGRSTLNIHTTEPLFIGLTVTATAGTETKSGVFDSNGDCVLVVESVGVEFTVSVTYSGKKYSSKINVPYYSSYNVTLMMDASVIGITTASSELYSKGVKVALDGDSYYETGTINTGGACDISVSKLGTYTVTCTDATVGSHVPSKTIVVDEFLKRYPVTLTYNYATICVKTSESDLLGRPITVTDGTHNYSATFPASFPSGSTEASVDVVVYDTGDYTVSSSTSGGDDTSETVNVLAYFTTNDIELTLNEALVPTMTSNTTPSGEVIYSSGSSTPYKAFDGGVGNDDVWHCQLSSAGQANGKYIGYIFTNPSLVKKVGLTQRFLATAQQIKTFKIQASNDNFSTVGWESGTLTAEAVSENREQMFDLDNDTYYSSYRLYCLTNNGDNYVSVAELQFYGKALNGLVPTMTGYTTPSGEVIGNGTNQTGREFWRAFDGIQTTMTEGVATSNFWVGYDFTKNVLPKVAIYKCISSATAQYIKSGEINYSDDGTNWSSSVGSFNDKSIAEAKSGITITISETSPHRYWRLKDNADGSNAGNISILQFYKK